MVPIMDLNEAVAKALSAERAIAGLTVRELSERSGVPKSTLMRVLGAQREIRADQIEKLAKALNLRPSQILRSAELLMEREKGREAATPFAAPAPVPVGVVPDWTQLAAHQPGYSFEDELAEQMDTP